MLEHYQQWLLNTDLSVPERVQVLCRVAWLWIERGDLEAAIAPLDEALTLQPDAVMAHHYRAMLLERLGQFQAAIAHYDQAIQFSPTPDVELWVHRGNALRSAGRYRKALQSFEQALALQPEHLQALSGKGALLALLGQKREALKCCRRALERDPEAAEAWHSMGVVLSVSGRNWEALSHFQRALELQPGFDRALCNRGMVLARLERFEEAIADLNAALGVQGRGAAQQPGNPVQGWHGGAWAYRAFALLRLGEYEQAIASCERALDLQPRSYLASLYKVVSLVMAGQFWRYLSQPGTRRPLLGNFWTILNFLKYRLLILAGIIFLLSSVQGYWMDVIRRVLPILLSLGVIAIIISDLWKHRSRLNLVWKTYFINHPLTYVRSLLTVIITLLTYVIADSIAPPILRWGWSNLVFGQPGNIIFQPFNLLKDVEAPLPSEPAIASHPFSSDLSTVASSAPLQIDYSLIFILMFWALLLVGIPFWAQMEERIFRRGANTWKQIAVRSTQFGLVHLLAGIPILGGLVLILPGFLFACRYKYIHDRHLKRTGDPLAAQEAGVAASTADHAVYNAILITLVVWVLLSLQ